MKKMIRVLVVYKNSNGNQVAVDIQDCETERKEFIELKTFINLMNKYNYGHENFSIVENSYIRGKQGVDLHFKDLLTCSEIEDRYPETNVKLSNVIRYNNSSLGGIMYASVEGTASDIDCDKDIVSNLKKGIEVDWLCTRREKGRIIV